MTSSYSECSTFAHQLLSWTCDHGKRQQLQAFQINYQQLVQLGIFPASWETNSFLFKSWRLFWLTCEISAVSRVASSHHVLGVEHLLCELGHREGPVLLAAPGGEGGEPWHEEVKTREGHHVHCQLPQVSVELAGEPEAGGDP